MAKKPTIRQLEEKINILSYNLNHVMTLLDSIGRGFSAYITFKGDESDFKKHLESSNKRDKLKENDGKDEKNKV
jgi:hypothetical protein